VDRYHQWQILRERALQNTPGGKFPSVYKEVERPPPPLSPIVDDTDIMDLSMELNAATIDDVIPGDLDESGMEKVPMADPVMEVSKSSPKLGWKFMGSMQQPFPEIGTERPHIGQGPHVRRKSVLPGM
jgi:serine/threonine-protein phosphatase 2A regulatory subunit B'